MVKWKLKSLGVVGWFVLGLVVLIGGAMVGAATDINMSLFIGVGSWTCWIIGTVKLVKDKIKRSKEKKKKKELA